MGVNTVAVTTRASQASQARAADDLRVLRSDRKLYVFMAGPHRVLFRIDGLILTVSEVFFTLMDTLRNLGPEDAVAVAAARFGETALLEFVRDCESLRDSGVLFSDIPDSVKLNPGPGTSGMLVMITQTCNLKCLYCYADAGTYGSPVKYQSSHNIERALQDLIQRAGTRTELKITFFGGEPLMNFPLVKQTVERCEALGHELGKNFSFSITTNATIITEEIISFLRHHRFTVMVSFDGAERFQNAYRPMSNGKGSFTVVAENIKRIVAANLPLQLRGTIVREMIDRAAIDEMVGTAAALGARRFILSPVDCTQKDRPGLAFEDGDEDRLEDLFRAYTEENIEQAQPGRRVIFDPYVSIMKSLAKGDVIGMGRCGAFRGMSAVSTEGKVYPCHRFVGMDEYQIGNVEDGVDQSEIDRILQNAENAWQPKCATCMARLMCGGFCFYSMAAGKGSFRAPEESECEALRGRVRKAVEYLLQVRELPPKKLNDYLNSVRSL